MAALTSSSTNMGTLSVRVALTHAEMARATQNDWSPAHQLDGATFFITNQLYSPSMSGEGAAVCNPLASRPLSIWGQRWQTHRLECCGKRMPS